MAALVHYLFYQHNVQKFFIRHIEKFDGIIVPFSIAVSFTSGTYGFLRALLAKDRTKCFALDPRSALFQHNWNRLNVREPHRKAAAVLDGPFFSDGLSRPLTASDFSSTDTVKRVTEACIRFQMEFRVLQEEKRKLDKYRKLLGMETMPEIENPQKFIPPYFQFQDQNDPWFEVSMRCTEHAASIVSPQELTPIIHFSDWTKFDEWPQLTTALTTLGIGSVLLYPNEFKEHNADQTALVKYSEAVASLVTRRMLPQALHGGYFAVLLEKKGLFGFGNGVGYGEWRDSGYHRGGTAEVRIYIPKLHRFLDSAAAQNLVQKDREYFTADSDLLTEYALANKPLTEVQLQEALDHFMESRYQEIAFVRANTLDTVVAELNGTIEKLQNMGELEMENYGRSLQRWSGVIAA